MKLNSAKKVLERRKKFLKDTYSPDDTGASFKKAEISALEKALVAFSIVKKNNLTSQFNEKEEEKEDVNSQVNPGT